MSELKIKYGDFTYGGIDIDFYFDGEKVQSFWFSLCADTFTSITDFLEQFLEDSGPQILWAKTNLSDTQRIYKTHTVTLDGEGPDLDIKLEEIQTATPCGEGIEFDYDRVRLTISGFEDESDYLEAEPVSHVMIGNKKQILGELYFSMMNVLGFEVTKNGHNDEYYNQNPLQEYNDCKSLKIEEFLFPELKKTLC